MKKCIFSLLICSGQDDVEHPTALVGLLNRVTVPHYGLNLADPRAQEFLFEQMDAFFFGEGAQVSGVAPQAAAPSKK